MKYRLDLVDVDTGWFRGLRSGIMYKTVRFSGEGAIIRPLPVYDEESENHLTPTCVYEGGNVYTGDWLRLYPKVSLRQGDRNIVFIPYHPMEWLQDEDLYNRNPIILLQEGINAAVNTGIAPPSWEEIFPKRGEKLNKAPLVSFDMKRYFTLAVVLVEDDTTFSPPLGSDKSHGFVLVELAKTAGEAVRELIRNSEDQLKLVEPSSEYCLFINPTRSKRTDVGFVPNKYRVKLMKISEITREPFSVDAIMEKIIKMRLRWDDFLTPLSPEQQVYEICKSSVPPEAVVYAFEGTEYEEYLPKKYKEVGMNKLNSVLKLSHKSSVSDQASNEPAESPVSSDIDSLSADILAKLKKLREQTTPTEEAPTGDVEEFSTDMLAKLRKLREQPEE